ncbi:MAG: RNA 2',3'-cyclic phosphodiesterase [Egibacteraceae bacterium]
MRLFVAVAVPPAVREAVAAAAAPLRGMSADLRWTDPAGWHLTVAFLGQTDPGALDALSGALAEVTAGFGVFDVRLRPAAGRGARSSVLWVELEPCKPLQAVAAAVNVVARGLGLKAEDQAFRPHLTLARARASVPRSLADAYHGPAVAWTVPDLELVRSHLRRAGARYETVASFPFAS